MRMYLTNIHRKASKAIKYAKAKVKSTRLSNHALRKALKPECRTNDFIAWMENRAKPVFFINFHSKDKPVKLIEREYPDSIERTIQAADEICHHIFDLLGSGKVNLGERIDWHADFKTGYRWPLKHYIRYRVTPDRPCDIKVPWELSRCHHFVTLGKAYWYTNDEKYAREFVAQITDWIEANPPEFGVNWRCTMDVAIRAVNWIWAYYFFSLSPSFTAEVKREFLKSILSHGRYIINNLEEISGGNHYLSDGVGLVYLGVLFPEFKESKKWLDKGLEIVFGEMEKQVYHDGVDFEMSISYHRLVLELFLSSILLCLKNDISVPEKVMERLEKMLEYVMYYTKPDGTCSLLGDADNGRSHILADNDIIDHRYLLSTGAVLFNSADFKKASGGFNEESFWLLGKEGLEKFHAIPTSEASLKSKAFPKAGIYIMRHDDLYMIVDCGDNGYDGQGIHGHNDTLSFELCAYGHTFITDSGTYVYTAAPVWRNRFRSTAYHNTVVVDKQEMNPIDETRLRLFSLPTVAQPTVNKWDTTTEYDLLDAQHNGYERLPEPVTHRRQIYFDKKDGYWIIKDILTGEGEHLFEWYFHFDSDIKVEIVDALSVKTQSSSAAGVILHPLKAEGFNVELVDSWVSKSYGIKEQAQGVKYSKQSNVPLFFSMVISPYESYAPEILNELMQKSWLDFFFPSVV